MKLYFNYGEKTQARVERGPRALSYTVFHNTYYYYDVYLSNIEEE